MVSHVDILLEGDAAVRVKELEKGSVDLLVTDAPYGLQFAGKDWDKAVPSVEVWKGCEQALKPGAFAFIMSAPRLDLLSQMALRLQQAHFQVDFTPIFWTFSSGMPKAQSVSKSVDKRLGAKRRVVGIKPGHEEFVNRQTTGDTVFKGALESFDRPWMHDPEARKRYHLETAAATSQARALEGAYAGFNPKPAVEVIIVAMKRLSEETYTLQALKNQKGVTWLGDGRIPFASAQDVEAAEAKNKHADFGSGPRENRFYGMDRRPRSEQGNYDAARGRFPANLLVNDDVVNTGRPHGGHGHFNMRGAPPAKEVYDGGWRSFEREADIRLDDAGSFSRYFDLDRWFMERLKHLPESVQRTFPFLVCPKASRKERGEGRSVHPTIKPIKLVSYLITIGSRPGDLVLDPFIGSGTTALAARMLSRHYIGIEVKPEYVKIAKARLEGGL